MKTFRLVLFVASLLAGLTMAELSLAETNDGCLDCHADAEQVGEELAVIPELFDHSAHAEVGCAACHSDVSGEHPDDGMAPGKPVCRDCHQETQQDYSASRHSGHADCSDCHNPHAVVPFSEVSGTQLNRPCLSCHDMVDVQGQHRQWLPQVRLHLQALPCVTCHTGSENYQIELYISGWNDDRLMPLRAEELTAYHPYGGESLIDLDLNGTVSLKELRHFNLDPELSDLQLKGMLVPSQATHSFDIHDNRWDCSFCHASGPEVAQVAFLLLPGNDGRVRKLPVERGAVLDVLYGTPDFYMLGATRNRALDWAGLVILAGGLMMPLSHGSLRFFTRKKRARKDPES